MDEASHVIKCKKVRDTMSYSDENITVLEEPPAFMLPYSDKDQKHPLLKPPLERRGLLRPRASKRSTMTWPGCRSVRSLFTYFTSIIINKCSHLFSENKASSSVLKYSIFCLYTSR